MRVNLTVAQAIALEQAANAMLAGEQGEGDAAGVDFVALDKGAQRLAEAIYKQEKDKAQ